MLQEQYEYNFADFNSWTGTFNGESQTLLSNIELSTTYKFNLGGYFIDGGPYIKIPTNGVGHGNVKLRSFGFRVGVSLVK